MKYTKKKPKPYLFWLALILVCLVGCQKTQEGTFSPVIKDAATAVANAPLPADNAGAIVGAVTAAAPFVPGLVPYVPLVQAGLVLWGAIATLIAASKAKTAAANDLKYKSMKQGTESFRVNNPTAAPVLYAAIGEARTALGVK